MQRLARLRKVLETDGKPDCPLVLMHRQAVCKDVSHLMATAERIFAAKGEGVIIKSPDSLYERKRSSFLLKVKKFEDAEATVIAHEKGVGEYTGKMGALRVTAKGKKANGKEFKIASGFSDKQR